jgi:hypothetical protein
MSNAYIMQFTYEKQFIDDCLIPWNNVLKLEKNDNANNINNANNTYNHSKSNIMNQSNDLNILDTGWITNKFSINLDKSTEMIEKYQVGISIKCPINCIQFITPFFIHIPYSNCRIFNDGHSFKLKLNTFCYYTRLASYILEYEEDWTLEYWNSVIKLFSETSDTSNIINAINYDLSENKINLSNIILKSIDDDEITLPSVSVKFKNTMNQNMYPFIWLECNLIGTPFYKTNDALCNLDESNENDYLNEKFISGTPIIIKNMCQSVAGSQEKSNNELLGIIYNCENGILNIIPSVTIINIVNGHVYKNIFIETEKSSNFNNFQNTNSEIIGPLIVKQVFAEKDVVQNKNILTTISQMDIGDYIMSINDNDLNEDGCVYFDVANIHVPLNTYIYYSHISKHSFSVIRNNQLLTLLISSQNIINQINFKIDIYTTFCIKDNIIFSLPNLLMVEWLTYNDIIIKNNLYLQYMLTPFHKSKCLFLLIGLINIDQHPKSVRDIIKPYIDNIYQVTKYNEFFTVLSINGLGMQKFNNYKTINKITFCDSNDKELNFNWIVA